MLIVLALSMLAGYLLASVLFEADIDDDDNGPGGGIMIPASNPV